LRDSTTNGPGGTGPSGSNGIRTETLKSKWQFYRLRGSQTNFVTSEGFPTILSNPIIESSFQKSSCMTCHALASVGIRGTVPIQAPACFTFSGGLRAQYRFGAATAAGCRRAGLREILLQVVGHLPRTIVRPINRSISRPTSCGRCRSAPSARSSRRISIGACAA